MAVTSLHHVSLRTQDPNASRGFYERIGFSFMEIPVGGETVSRWRGSPEDGVLLATQVGSTFVILQPPLQGCRPDDRFDEHRIGIDHLAFGVESRDDLASLLTALAGAGVDTAGIETDPVLGKEYVCFRDPDNVQWEFYIA
jgi:glyoxylase I family protein